MIYKTYLVIQIGFVKLSFVFSVFDISIYIWAES